MNKLDYVLEKSKTYKREKNKNKFMKKHFGTCSGEVVTIESLVSMVKNMIRLQNEDMK